MYFKFLVKNQRIVAGFFILLMASSWNKSTESIFPEPYLWFIYDKKLKCLKTILLLTLPSGPKRMGLVLPNPMGLIIQALSLKAYHSGKTELRKVAFRENCSGKSTFGKSESEKTLSTCQTIHVFHFQLFNRCCTLWSLIAHCYYIWSVPSLFRQ